MNNRWNRELLVVGCIVIAGLLIRLPYPTRMAIEHFDEGVYASNLLCSFNNNSYPSRFLYAPPLVPTLIEVSIMAVGTSFAPFLPSLAFGVLTTILVWWVGRRWFGPSAGIASAILVAFCDLHLLYCRTALTDVAAGFFLLASVWLIWESYCSPRTGWSILAGLAVGLGWWTKYNKGLPLAIGVSGLVAWLLLSRRSSHEAKRGIVRWLTVAVVAGIVWFPYLNSIQPLGGYAAVAANHSRFTVGLGGWFDSASTQLANLRHFDGLISHVGIGLCLAIPMILHEGRLRRSTWNIMILSGSLMAATMLLGSFCLLAGLSILGLGGNLAAANALKARSDSHDESTGPSVLATWLLAAWWLGLLVAIPLYTPYPRLLIPWLLASCLAVGAAVQLFQDRVWVQIDPSTGLPVFSGGVGTGRQRALMVIGLAALIVVVWHGSAEFRRGVAGWQSRAGLRSVAMEIRNDVLGRFQQESEAASQPCLVYVYAEPGLFFHLPDEQIISQPVASLDLPAQPIPTFLAIGPHGQRDPELIESLVLDADRFEPVAEYRFRASDLVRLNHYTPSELASLPEEQVRLFRVK